MSDAKKKHNRIILFWEGGYVGVKDFDDNIIISPLLQFNEIRETEEEDVIIVRKGNKWALTDLEGKPLCPFIYDHIVFIGEHCYKAGIYIGQHDNSLIVEYLDTRMTYAILDAKGNILCSRDKGYHYISEVHKEELTAAINGRCGIIDLQGNVRMDFRYKYIQPMGEEHYLVSFDNKEENYFATIINRLGEVKISAKKQYRSIGCFHNNIAIAYQNENWGLIDDNGNHIGKFEYSFVDEWGESFYKAEKGTKKNILRPDGSVVLKEWYNDVFRVHQGFFIFGNTIKKSKNNQKTRYIQGVAHVSGAIIFPMIFEKVQWCKDGNTIYAEIDEKPYILTLNGGIYDPAHTHLPQKSKINWTKLFEKFANWTLPGLQFYYRDTNAQIDVKTTYHIGDILRAGFFLDATTQLCKPTHKTRFLIASAHAAHFFMIDELIESNPKVKEWNLCTFHFNSFFKVMDIYEKDGFIQVFLLHIPPAVAFFLGHSESAINFINRATGQEFSLIEMARKSLDDKLSMNIHPRSLDSDFVERMFRPVGLDNNFYPISIFPMKEPECGEVAHISNMIHKLSADEDIKNFIIEEKDNFPYTGVKNSICEKCIYANGIVGNGEGCGRLFINSFRNRYLKGVCEYRKKNLFEPSIYESLNSYRLQKEKEAKEKISDVYALNLLKDFINEELNRDISNLRTFNISKVRDNSKYGDCVIGRAPIVRAIMVLVFADAWPELSVKTIEKCQYWCSHINHYNSLFGANIIDQYFKGMQKFNPTNEQKERAFSVFQLINTIGNIWILPNKDSFDKCLNETKYRGYVDKFLKSMYDIFNNATKVDNSLKGVLYKNRKLMQEYQGIEGWHKFINKMMLNDYVDENSVPKILFKHVWSSMKDLSKEEYFEAFDLYCSFCEKFISKRSNLIVEKLKDILENNE